MLHRDAKAYLDRLDHDPQPLTLLGEHDIAEELRTILIQDKDYDPSDEDKVEQIAFDFMANYHDETSGWGTYHAPRYILPNNKGQIVEYPSIQRVNKKTLDYWRQRAHASPNQILKARYADLVHDFSPKILNTAKLDIELLRFVIDCNIAICDNSFAEPLQCKTKLHRALVLAIKVRDQTRIKCVIKHDYYTGRKCGH